MPLFFSPPRDQKTYPYLDRVMQGRSDISRLLFLAHQKKISYFSSSLKRKREADIPPSIPPRHVFPEKRWRKSENPLFFLERNFICGAFVGRRRRRPKLLHLPPFVVPSLNFNQKRSILGSEGGEKKRGKIGLFFRCCTIFYFRLCNRAGEKKL